MSKDLTDVVTIDGTEADLDGLVMDFEVPLLGDLVDPCCVVCYPGPQTVSLKLQAPGQLRTILLSPLSTCPNTFFLSLTLASPKLSSTIWFEVDGDKFRGSMHHVCLELDDPPLLEQEWT
jgi:hypothetical protein